MMRKLSKTWITSAHQGFVDENLHSNTLAAYELSAKKGADMIETDARMTRDGVLICNHDPDVKCYDKSGNEVRYVISETDYSVIRNVSLLKERAEENRVAPLFFSTPLCKVRYQKQADFAERCCYFCRKTARFCINREIPAQFSVFHKKATAFSVKIRGPPSEI